VLDGFRWRAHALPARRFGATAHSAARAFGLFVFLEIYTSGAGTLCHCVCSGSVGGGLFGPAEGSGSFHARNGNAHSEVCSQPGPIFLRFAGDIPRRSRCHVRSSRIAAGRRAARTASDSGLSCQSVFCSWEAGGALPGNPFWGSGVSLGGGQHAVSILVRSRATVRRSQQNSRR
jgi:hypothetical protein